MYCNPLFSDVMSHDRFILLVKYLHFNDNTRFDANDMDNNPKLFKIKPILDYIVNKFKTTYIPERDIAIDESLLLWKGRLGWKMYIPNKRSRFGIESFKLCESSSGYIWNLIVYTGRSNILYET